jgi:lipopolysaccharide transport system ATP-binding protein
MFQQVRNLGRLLGLRRGTPAPVPTVFHITHHKAGSQWILRILHALAYDHLVQPQLKSAQFFGQPVLPGKVYPTLYITREQFESVALPRRWRRFVVIRDIRDTLVSAYFSLKNSHELQTEQMRHSRAELNSTTLEKGLLFLLDNWLPGVATVQWSWVAAREKLIKYEDLLKDDEGILERVLLRDCRLPVSRAKLRDAVRANRFEARTGGRKPGIEDIHSHERKGIAGDWRNYFTDRVSHAFKARHGSLLVATGYERGFNW